MPNYEIVKTEDLEPDTRRGPMITLKQQIPPGFLTYEDLSTRYGISIHTLRRICKTPDLVKAPSQVIKMGKMKIYLFSAEDVAELDEYLEPRGYTPIA